MKKNQITILYVDDEEINLLVFEKNFERKFSILTATSGQEGLTKLEQHGDEIDVVVSDMKMPQMNGVEFIRSARESNPDIVYFILSGFQYNEEIDEAVKNGNVQQFFMKPMNMEEITNVIEKTTNNSL
ncbi:response regulator [Reichenbachiella sp.]|uniref:response regulator n=1 Tax=Reichenbachiella sp. TaxID=2184521 RepID=UPI003BAEA1B7